MNQFASRPFGDLIFTWFYPNCLTAKDWQALKGKCAAGEVQVSTQKEARQAGLV